MRIVGKESLIVVLVAFSLTAPAWSAEEKTEGEEQAVLTYAPEVPPVILRTKPAKVVVRLETKELKQRLADGVEYTLPNLGFRCAMDLPTRPAAADVGGTLPRNSLYRLHSSWKDQEGIERPIETLKGVPRVVALFFTGCSFSCPLVISDMKWVQSELERIAPNNEVGYTLVSIDLESDTPLALKELAKKRGLDTVKHWTLLTGNQEGVRELAAALGFSYRKTGKSDFTHAFLLSVVDRDGIVVHQQAGESRDPAPAMAKLRELIETRYRIVTSR